MNVTIERPDLQQFVQEQVRAGRFTSAEDVIAAALNVYRESTPDDDFDDETAERLNRAYGRADRGEGGHTIEEARERLLGRRADR